MSVQLRVAIIGFLCWSALVIGETPRERKGIVFPDLPTPAPLPPAPPTPPPNPSDPVKLTAEIIYVIRSDGPLIVASSPNGIVTIQEEQGPLRVRGKFIDEPGKVQTKTFSEPKLYFVEAVGTGQCELLVWPVGSTDARNIQRRLIETNVAPQPPPQPRPEPPTPVEGFRVLIVYDSKDANQPISLSAKEVRDYLAARCVKVNGEPERRMLPANTDTRNMLQHWQAAFERTRGKQLPWLIIMSGGRYVFEGPWPADTSKAMDLLRKYGG
jgi:hypothetical protein